MRIALLTYSTRPRGGVVHTLALAEALVALGEDVDVWSIRRDERGFFRPVDPRVGIRLVGLTPIEDESVGARIVRSIDVLGAAFDARSYDVIHAQDCITANAAPQCIRTIHHLDTFTTPELVACHERAIVRPSAHVCVSAAVAAEVRVGWGIEATVIPNGVDAARFEAGASDLVGRARWRERLGPYILAVGGIVPRKGTADLVEAMAVVGRHRPDLHLVIAGGDTLFDYRTYRDDVLRRAAELGVRLEILGPVEQDRLPALVAQAEAFAFPSLQEGFGLAALEALAAAVPVVARDLPVLREVLGDSVRYASAPRSFAAAILDAAGDRDATRMGTGRERARRYTWEATAYAHRTLYRRLNAHAAAQPAPVVPSPVLRS